LPGFLELDLEDFEVEQAQFAVGDDEEIAAAAGGVEEVQGGDFAAKSGDFLVISATFGQFCPKFAEKKRLDEAANIFSEVKCAPSERRSAEESTA